MLESFLSQLLFNVSRRPWLLLHIVVAFTILVILKLIGIYLPYIIVNNLEIEEVIPRKPEVTMILNLTIAIASLFIYSVLITIIYYIIDKALKST